MAKVFKKLIVCIMVFLMLFDFFIGSVGDIGTVFAAGDSEQSEEASFGEEDGELETSLSGLLTGVLNGLAGILTWLLRALVVGLATLLMEIPVIVLSIGGNNSTSALFSPMDLFYNSYPLTDINIFKSDGNTFVNAIRGTMRGVFIVVEVVCIVILFIMLIVAFVRRFISTNPEDKSSATNAITDCAWSIGLVVFMDFIIIIILVINETIIGLMQTLVANMTDDYGTLTTELMSAAMSAGFLLGMGATIAYIMYCWQFIKFAIQYVFRFFMVSFLIMISPIMGLLYNRSRARNGNPGIFNRWFKSFLGNVIVQPVDCLLYLVFVAVPLMYIEIGVSITNLSGLGGSILLIIGLMFVKRGEKFIMNLLGMDDNVISMNSVTNSINKAANTAVNAAVTGISTVSSVVGGNTINNNSIQFGKNQEGKNGEKGTNGANGSTGVHMKNPGLGAAMGAPGASAQGRMGAPGNGGTGPSGAIPLGGQVVPQLPDSEDGFGGPYDNQEIDNDTYNIVDENGESNSETNVNVNNNNEENSVENNNSNVAITENNNSSENNENNINVNGGQPGENGGNLSPAEIITKDQKLIDHEEARKEGLGRFKDDYNKLLNEMKDNMGQMKKATNDEQEAVKKMSTLDEQMGHTAYEVGKNKYENFDPNKVNNELNNIYGKEGLDGIRKYIDDRKDMPEESMSAGEAEYAKAYLDLFEKSEEREKCQTKINQTENKLDDLMDSDDAKNVFDEDERGSLKEAFMHDADTGESTSSELLDNKEKDINNKIALYSNERDENIKKEYEIELNDALNPVTISRLADNKNFTNTLEGIAAPMQVIDGKIDISYENLSRISTNFKNGEYSDNNLDAIKERIRKEGKDKEEEFNRFCNAQNSEQATKAARALTTEAQKEGARFVTERQEASVIAYAATTSYSQTVSNNNNEPIADQSARDVLNQISQNTQNGNNGQNTNNMVYNSNRNSNGNNRN